MAARQVGIRARRRRKERRILRERGVRRVAPADPQLVLPLLQPAHRRPAAVHLEPEAVLVARAHLSDRNGSFRAASEAGKDPPESPAWDTTPTSSSAPAPPEPPMGSPR